MFGFLRFLAMAVTTLVMAVPAIAVALLDRGGRASSAIVAAWARLVLALAGVRVAVEGREHLPAEGAQVYVATHQSMLDIPALFRAVPARTRFVAKKELFRIPLFGQAIGLLGFIPIDRGDARKAHRSMSRAGDATRERRPILVFPEGTRGSGEDLLPFKKGAFVIAHRLRLPVVPIACLGGRALLPPGAARVRPGTMVLRVGEPLPPTHEAFASHQALQAAVRERLEALAAPSAGEAA